MTVPLAHFLTRFSTSAPVAVDVFSVAEPPTPLVTMTPTDLEERIATARREATAETAAFYVAEAAAATESHTMAAKAAVATARAAWSAAEGERLAALMETAVSDLRAMLSDRLAAVVRPWLSETARVHAETVAGEALDRLLAEGSAAGLRVSGPEDLVVAMRAARSTTAVDWQIAESVDVTIVADSTRIETRLAAALSDLAKEI